MVRVKVRHYGNPARVAMVNLIVSNAKQMEILLFPLMAAIATAILNMVFDWLARDTGNDINLAYTRQ